MAPLSTKTSILRAFKEEKIGFKFINNKLIKLDIWKFIKMNLKIKVKGKDI